MNSRAVETVPLGHHISLEASAVQVAFAVKAHPGGFLAAAGRFEHVDESPVCGMTMELTIANGYEYVALDERAVQRRQVELVTGKCRHHHASLIRIEGEHSRGFTVDVGHHVDRLGTERESHRLARQGVPFDHIGQRIAAAGLMEVRDPGERGNRAAAVWFGQGTPDPGVALALNDTDGP